MAPIERHTPHQASLDSGKGYSVLASCPANRVQLTSDGNMTPLEPLEAHSAATLLWGADASITSQT